MNADVSFKAYAAQSPTMQTLAANRKLWKLNLCLALAAALSSFAAPQPAHAEPTEPAPSGVSMRAMWGPANLDGIDTVVDITPVVIAVDHGHPVTTGRGEAKAIAEIAARGETDDQYHARIAAQLCEAKPWVCG